MGINVKLKKKKIKKVDCIETREWYSQNTRPTHRIKEPFDN